MPNPIKLRLGVSVPAGSITSSLRVVVCILYSNASIDVSDLNSKSGICCQLLDLVGIDIPVSSSKPVSGLRIPEIAPRRRIDVQRMRSAAAVMSEFMPTAIKMIGVICMLDVFSYCLQMTARHFELTLAGMLPDWFPDSWCGLPEFPKLAIPRLGSQV
jgi:hypothetical protein